MGQVMQQQQGGSSPCIEVGQYGIEEEIDRLKRDRNVLMAEIVKLRQSQQNSKDRLIAMENRVRMTERKQQHMMGFLAKAFSNPTFIQLYVDKYAEKRGQRQVEIGRKRRLTMSPSVENLQDVASTEIANAHVPQEMGNTDTDIDTFFSDSLEDELSGDAKDPEPMQQPFPVAGVPNFEDFNEGIWEELLNEDLAIEDGEVLVGDDQVEVEDLAAKTPDWGEDLQELVDQMDYLRSNP